jgi:hypothetical protein
MKRYITNIQASSNWDQSVHNHGLFIGGQSIHVKLLPWCQYLHCEDLHMAQTNDFGVHLLFVL